MPPAETLVLEALRSHADRLTWHKGKDGEWAKITTEDARSDLHVINMESATFKSILRILVINKLYREIDSEHGWVNLGELPPPPE